MKQGKNTVSGKSKGGKDFDNFDEVKKSFNSKLTDKKSSKNWKNNLFEKDDDDLYDDFLTTNDDDLDEEE